MSKAFVVRMVIWSALIIYILCDFFIFSGPLKDEARRMFPTDADKIRKAMEMGVCANVYNEPIYYSKIIFFFKEMTSGLSWESALNELIAS